MFQVQLINTVVEWERKLQMEEEKRNNLKGIPYEKHMAASTSSRKEHNPNVAGRLRYTEVNQPASNSAYDPCGEMDFNKVTLTDYTYR